MFSLNGHRLTQLLDRKLYMYTFTNLKANIHGAADYTSWVDNRPAHLPRGIVMNGKSSEYGALFDRHARGAARAALEEMGDPFVTVTYTSSEGNPIANKAMPGHDGRIVVTDKNGRVRRANGKHLEFFSSVAEEKRKSVNYLIDKIGCSNEALMLLCDTDKDGLEAILGAGKWGDETKIVCGMTIPKDIWKDNAPDEDAKKVSGMPGTLPMFADGSERQKAAVTKLRCFLACIAPHVEILSSQAVEREDHDVQRGVAQHEL